MFRDAGTLADMSEPARAATLGALRATGFPDRSVKEELRANLTGCLVPMLLAAALLLLALAASVHME